MSDENELKNIANPIGVDTSAWGLPYVDAIVTTLNALGVLAGAVIGASALKAKFTLAA